MKRKGLTGTDASVTDNEQRVDGKESGYDQEDDCADPSKGLSKVLGRLARAVGVCGADDADGDGSGEGKTNKVPVGGYPGNRVPRNMSTDDLAWEK